MSNEHLGSSIDDLLKEEGIFEEAQAQALKEVVAWQVAEAMRRKENIQRAHGHAAQAEPHSGQLPAGPRE